MRTGLAVLAGVCGVWFIMAETVSAQGTWVEDVGNSLAFYQTTHPGPGWTPYIDELTRARDGMRRGDQLTVTRAMIEFQKMLRTRAYGIDEAAAEDLYNLTLTLGPVDEPSAAANELNIRNERSMSVPNTPAKASSEGNMRCHEAGCDYWLDNVFDPGAG
jgi:hypothetical protein